MKFPITTRDIDPAKLHEIRKKVRILPLQLTDEQLDLLRKAYQAGSTHALLKNDQSKEAE